MNGALIDEIRTMPRLLACVLIPAWLLGQTPTRPVGKAVASKALNAWRTSVQELPDGRVLVVDSLKRLVLLDSNLAFLRVVIDSIPTRIRPRWASTGFLIPVGIGEAYFVDGVRPLYSRVVGDSVVASNIALPRPDLVNVGIFDNMGGRPAFDGTGRLVYSALPTFGPVNWAFGDSAWVFGIDPLHPRAEDNRRLPSRTAVAVAQFRRVDSLGRLHPTVANDLWAVAPDGVIVLRASGTVVEKWSIDGGRLAMAKLPYIPRVIDAAEKRRIVDSVRSEAEAYKAKYSQEPVVTEVVPASQLGDTLPAYRGDQPMIDPSGRIWVVESPLVTRTDSTVALIIDVSGNFGRVVDRRILPPGVRIAGFGANSVYLWRPFGPLQRVIIDR